MVELMAQHAGDFLRTPGLPEQAREHDHVAARQREGIDDVAPHHRHLEVVGVVGHLIRQPLGDFLDRRHGRPLLDHALPRQKLRARRLAEQPLPIGRDPIDDHLDHGIGLEPEQQAQAQAASPVAGRDAQAEFGSTLGRVKRQVSDAEQLQARTVHAEEAVGLEVDVRDIGLQRAVAHRPAKAQAAVLAT